MFKTKRFIIYKLGRRCYNLFNFLRRKNLSIPNKRRLLFGVNHFQKIMIVPLVFSFGIGCIVSWLSIVYFSLPESSSFNSQKESLERLIPWLLGLCLILILGLVLAAYFSSSKIAGPYQRIIRELDEVVAGTKKSSIVVRKGDVMFENLLVRINRLIKKIAQSS